MIVHFKICYTVVLLYIPVLVVFYEKDASADKILISNTTEPVSNHKNCCILREPVETQPVFKNNNHGIHTYKQELVQYLAHKGVNILRETVETQPVFKNNNH